jgi:predicted site-specific integrase-resolvase
MSDLQTLGFPQAAQRLGVSISVLRRAIRAGRISAPAHLTAVSPLSAEWLASAEAAVKSSPDILSRRQAQKTPAFARYKGTSAWRKYAARVREYARFQATK